MKKNKRRKKRKVSFYKILGFILLVVSAIFIGLIRYINLLPNKYFLPIVSIISAFALFNFLLLNLKRLKKQVKALISVLVILVILVMLLASFYLCRTLGVLSGNGESKYKLEHYSVIVLKDSNYKKLEDIKGETLGYYKNATGASEAIKYLENKVTIEYADYIAADTMASDLLNGKVNAILMEESIKNIILEEQPDFDKVTKEIYTFTIKVKNETTLKDVNVTEKPFVIYISGIDTYGEISSVSRSDVNMVVVINPKTKQMLLISIPRDYYVQLHGTTGVKDKLTHAGIYGIDMSIGTLEDLLDVEINYYLKVNFTSVIDIVDALGGVDVYSEYTFISYSDFSFKKGMNSVNGEEALDFARTRKAFTDGDRQRGKNQQALIEAIVRKATNKSIITKYNSLLSAIDGKYQTNMSMKKITSLIKMQLNDMAKWNITSYSLTGYDSSNYTYTYYQKLYVMEPDEDSVEGAKELIDKVFNGEVLDGSYDNIGGSSNKVYKTTPAPQPKKTEVKKEEQKEEIKTPEVKEEEEPEVIIPSVENNENEGEQNTGGNEDPIENIIPSEEE